MLAFCFVLEDLGAEPRPSPASAGQQVTGLVGCIGAGILQVSARVDHEHALRSRPQDRAVRKLPPDQYNQGAIDLVLAERWQIWERIAWPAVGEAQAEPDF